MSPGKINLFRFACFFFLSRGRESRAWFGACTARGPDSCSLTEHARTRSRSFLVPPVFYLVRSFTVHVIIFIGFHASTISVSSTPAKWIAIFAGLNWRAYFRAGDRSIGKPITNIFAKTDGEKHGWRGSRRRMIDWCSSDFSWLLNGLRIPFFFSFPTLFSPVEANHRLFGGVHVHEYQTRIPIVSR